MKKGFTLVELLAVIVILGVTTFLIVPNVSNTIKKSRIEAAKRSAESYVRAVEITAANNKQMKENIIYEGLWSIDELTLLGVEVTNQIEDATLAINNDMVVTYGDFCIKGFSIIYNNGKTTNDEDNKYCLTYPTGKSEIKFAKAAAGYDFSVAIDTNGNLWGWGNNSYGQLGYESVEKLPENLSYNVVDTPTFFNNSLSNYKTTFLINKYYDLSNVQETPKQITTNGHFVDVVAYYATTIVLDSDGKVFITGITDYYYLNYVSELTPLYPEETFNKIFLAGDILFLVGDNKTYVIGFYEEDFSLPIVLNDAAMATNFMAFLDENNNLLLLNLEELKNINMEEFASPYDLFNNITSYLTTLNDSNTALYTLNRNSNDIVEIDNISVSDLRFNNLEMIYKFCPFVIGITEDGNEYKIEYNYDTSKYNLINIDKNIKFFATNSEEPIYSTFDNKLYNWNITIPYEVYEEIDLDLSYEEYMNLFLISSDIDVKELAINEEHAIIIDTDGNLYTIGNNYFGQIGVEDYYSNSTLYHINKTTYSFKDVSSNSSSALAIDRQGYLYGWGMNTMSQLGLAGDDFYKEPTLILPNTRFSKTSMGKYYSLAIDVEGNLYGWGSLDGKTIIETPTIIKSGTKFKEISASLYNGYAIDVDGNLWYWGYDSSALQHFSTLLGSDDNIYDGNLNLINEPIKMAEGTKFSYVSASGFSMTAIDIEGNLWNYGILYPKSDVQVVLTTPTKMDINTKFKKVSASMNNYLAIDIDNNLYAWGADLSNYINKDDFFDDYYANALNYITTPTRILKGTKFKDILASDNLEIVNFALTINGELYAWGNLWHDIFDDLDFVPNPINIYPNKKFKKISELPGFIDSNNDLIVAYGEYYYMGLCDKRLR